MSSLRRVAPKAQYPEYIALKLILSIGFCLVYKSVRLSAVANLSIESNIPAIHKNVDAPASLCAYSVGLRAIQMNQGIDLTNAL